MRLNALSAAIVLAAATGIAQPAHAQFQEIMDGIGFGREKDPIEYRERAPLVVPPNLNLRSPEERPIAAREAKWPNDPDVLRKKAEDEESRRPRSSTANDNHNVRLSPEELRKGRVPGGEVGGNADSYHSRNNNGYDKDQDAYGRLSPDKLRAQGEAFNGLTREAPLKPGEEPKRRYLTEPPVGVRAPASGAPVVASAEKRGPDQNEESSPYAFFRRITGSDD